MQVVKLKSSGAMAGLVRLEKSAVNPPDKLPLKITSEVAVLLASFILILSSTKIIAINAGEGSF